MKKSAGAGALVMVMLLWGLHLGYPMHRLQHIRSTFLGYTVPLYYLFTVLLIGGSAALALAFKRRWSRWELLWWALPLICVPGILLSDAPMWSLRQASSWAIRGVIPGGIILLAMDQKKSESMLRYWVYPVIIAAALLGLTELYFNRNPLYNNPLWDGLVNHIPETSQPGNPFYRPDYAMDPSSPPMGTQGNRVPYASTLVGFLPLGLWFLKYQGKWSPAHLVAVGLLSGILLLAQVRAVWVATLVAVALMHAVGLRRNPRETRKIFAGALLCLGLFLAWPKTRHMLWPRINSFHLAEGSIQFRLAALGTARVLKDRWLYGVGFGQYPTACKPYYQSPLPWLGTPDNQYLRWAIENGVLSFALLLSFFGGLVRAGWKKIQLMTDVRQADFYKSILVGWLSIAVTFLFFDGFYWGACNMTFWCFLGMFATCLKSPESVVVHNGKITDNAAQAQI